MPVTAVGGPGDIQQLYGTADGEGQILVQNVMTSAHEGPPGTINFRDIDIILQIIALCNRLFLSENREKVVHSEIIRQNLCDMYKS